MNSIISNGDQADNYWYLLLSSLVAMNANILSPSSVRICRIFLEKLRIVCRAWSVTSERSATAIISAETWDLRPDSWNLLSHTIVDHCHLYIQANDTDLTNTVQASHIKSYSKLQFPRYLSVFIDIFVCKLSIRQVEDR